MIPLVLSTMLVRVMPTLHLLDVRLAGLLSCDDVASLKAEVGAAFARIGCVRGEHRSLYDISGCKIQSQAVIAAMRGAMKRSDLARQMAIVVGPSLMRMQVRRIVSSDDGVQLFTDRDEAMAWFARQRPPSSAPAWRLGESGGGALRP